MNKAVFFDRDGVIIEMVYDKENSFIHPAFQPSDVKFAPGIFDLLKTTKEKGYKNIIISNQPNIGLKRTTEENFQKVKGTIDEELKKNGVPFDGQYYCFHHPFAAVDKYRQKCDCRKPGIDLLLQASKDFDIDLKQSWMIGDGVADIIAGHNAGCKTILVANIYEAGYLKILEEKLGDIKPDYLVKNVKEIIKMFENMND